MKKILLLGFSCVLSFSVWAQERVITGRVTASEDGATLPGVNVVIKGTTNGTVTDSNGSYRIGVPSSGGVLVFSFIGLQTMEIPITERAVVDAVLQSDTQQLAEVVVTAQGILKTKNELSYSAQTVDGSEMTKTRGVNIANALSGKVAGVQIQQNNSMGGSTNVIIRGFKSLTGNNQALFVVDGVPIDNTTSNPATGGTATNSTNGAGAQGYDYGNAAADINPDDIESTTVLKGPAATALYGSRAANGVIYITTKKGRKKGMGVTVNSGVTMGVVDKSTFPKFQKEYGAGYGAYYGPGADAYFDEIDVNGDGVLDKVVPTYDDASIGAPFNPSLNVFQWNAFGDPTNPNFGKATPWVAAANDPIEYFKTAITTNNSVTIDGGGEKGYFKLGYTRNQETGVQPNSQLNKDYINFSSSYEIVKNLKASAQINFSKIDGKGRYATGYSGNNSLSSLRQWWQMNVDIKELEAAYKRTGQNITWNWASGLPTTGLIYWDNPYYNAYENYQTDNRLRYFGNVKLDYRITDWLSVMGRVSLDSYVQLQEERIAQGSINFGVPGNYTRRDLTFKEYNYDFMANFDKKLSDDFSIRGALGSNVRRNTQTGINATTNGGLSVPKVYALSNSIDPINPPVEVYADIQVNGVFANTEVGYKDFLFLEGSFRRDASSTLPKGNNAYNYGSASTSFVFSELLKSQDSWLTFGKLRMNYAEVGNTAPANSLRDLYNKPAAFGSVPLFSVPNGKNNDKLLPEKTLSSEIGLEMSFFDGRVGFDVTYFDSKTINQIMPVTVSTAVGYASKFINAGKLQNKGLEVTLTGTPLKISNFKWDVSVNWTKINNKVIELTEGLSNLPLSAWQGGGSLNAPLNGSYGSIWGSDYIYTNGERTVNATNGRYMRTTTVNNPIGSIIPNWTGGIQNTFSYKNTSLSFLIDMKNGGDVLSIDMYYGLATGLYAETAGLNELGNPVRSPRAEGGGILLPGVNPNGQPNTTRLNMLDWPQNGTQTTGPTGKYLYDASYVKLRELALTYSFPKAWLAKVPAIRSIDLSLVGRNLWIIHKNLPYSDPEDNLGAGNVQGLQVGAMPNIKTMGFNLKATF